MLYEAADDNNDDGITDLGLVHQLSSMWRYRAPITIENLSNSLDNTMTDKSTETSKTCSLLEAFLKQVHIINIISKENTSTLKGLYHRRVLYFQKLF